MSIDIGLGTQLPGRKLAWYVQGSSLSIAYTYKYFTEKQFIIHTIYPF